MNRIILIGNGFDLAHDLPTKYTDFLEWYWKENLKSMHGRPSFDGEFVKVTTNTLISTSGFNSYSEFKNFVNQRNRGYVQKPIEIEFKNKFFGHISDKTCLQTWLDIENEYYILLKDFLKERRKYIALWRTVKDLNNEFCEVKNMLEKYLAEVCERKFSIFKSVEDALTEPVKDRDIARSNSKRAMLIKQNQGGLGQIEMINYNGLLENASRYNFDNLNLHINKTIFLNFNYTDTAQMFYANKDDVVINIHGELNSRENPIIFGYGDELDDDYKEIEKTNDNVFLENIKSIQYHNTKNYRELLSYLETDSYQVFVMGHSCGNSDRTLLNTVFEHENCISIKPFFWDKGNGEDNYTEMVMNISRNFNDKQAMRDIVVNREFCQPLVPCNSE